MGYVLITIACHSMVTGSVTKPESTFSKLTIQTLEQDVKLVHS